MPGLSVISMAAALLIVGLASPWGEILPRWIPLLGGRRVPARGVDGVAVVGASIIEALTTYWRRNRPGAAGGAPRRSS